MQKQPTLIGLVGATGSGKGIVSRMMFEAGFVRIRFSDPAKAMLKVIGLTDLLMDGDAQKEPIEEYGNRTPHELVASLLDWGRRNSHELWANQYRKAVANIDKIVFTDDIRHPREAAVIRSLGGAIVRIARPASMANLSPAALALHRDACDFEIVNDGSMRLLRERAGAVVEAICRG